MVHEDDEKTRSLEILWRERPRYKRAEVVKDAQRSECGLLLQLQETEAIIKDAVDVHANLPRLERNVQEARNKLKIAEEVLREAIDVVMNCDQAKGHLRAAFDQTKEAWQRVPTFKRHQLWDRKLKKKVLKMLA